MLARNCKSDVALGWAATVTGIFMYVSYVDQIALNLHGHPGSTVLPIATTINCSLWVAYGLVKLKRDWPVVLANIPGIILGAVTLFTALRAGK